jgi:hypothetical protein
MSGTTWDGRRAIRVSVSNWQTGEDEIDLALDSFRRAPQRPGKCRGADTRCVAAANDGRRSSS